jgi:hydroxymethylpyrimidine pyrophosphatase-like HAD family hydrolase
MPGPSPSRRFDAVICDIDGCLSPESSDPMSAVRLAEIAEYNRLAQGVGDRPVVTVCSGRPQPFAEAMCRLLGNYTIPCVAENGVWVYDPATNAYLRDPAITADHLAAVHEASVWVERELGPKGVVIQPGKEASISLYHGDTAYLKGTVEPLVRDEFRRRAWPFRVSATWFYINCDLEHITKATGLDRLVARAGLRKDRLAGVGDTAGDRAIADHVAFFACPANADPAIKEHADFTSALSEVEGVLDILGRLRA